MPAARFRMVDEQPRGGLAVRVSRLILGATVLTASWLMAACGGDSDGLNLATQAQVSVVLTTAGVSPFIKLVRIQGAQLNHLRTIEFVIQPKTGTRSRPVHVTQTLARLIKQGHYAAGAAALEIPIFGLYSNFDNNVCFILHFDDNSSSRFDVTLTTTSYLDPYSLYDHLQVITPRTTSTIGFDFFFLKGLGAPVIVDTDGQIRWTGDPSVPSSTDSILVDGGFLIGSNNSLAITRADLDGTLTLGQVTPPISPTFIDFHHNIDPGKTGVLAEFDAIKGGVSYIETILAEISQEGQILGDWDMGDIIGQYMLSQGDDPTLFVRPGTDWFHMNASLYDPSDDSIIISSRENFLIKIDYQTKQIKWIFGDPTKYWYTFPSLRAKALTLANGLYPIGQHGISLTSNHELLLFNNGYPSFRQPSGAPSGASRNYSAVVAYSIDDAQKTVTQNWVFDHGKTIESDICGNVAQTTEGSVLIDYAYVFDPATQTTQNRLIGLDSSHVVAFDFSLPTSFCNTTFNAQVVRLEALTLQ